MKLGGWKNQTDDDHVHWTYILYSDESTFGTVPIFFYFPFNKTFNILYRITY